MMMLEEQSIDAKENRETEKESIKVGRDNQSRRRQPKMLTKIVRLTNLLKEERGDNQNQRKRKLPHNKVKITK